jgi:aryl-alcohol dehydrogenase-like predicted oxidoreductase
VSIWVVGQTEGHTLSESTSSQWARHPALASILSKLHRGVEISDEELQALRRQVAELEERASARRDASDPAVANVIEAALPGHAISPGVHRFIDHFGRRSHSGFYRTAQDIFISSLGIGTYRGAMNSETDASYAAAVEAALASGVNLIDTSLNYRHQRSERAVAAGIRLFIEKNGGRRDGIIVCTKGGYLVPEAITPGTLQPEDVAGGRHSMAPTFLVDQIDRSRRNLGVKTIDVYYIHNPETQLGFVAPQEFMSRIRAAFERLERCVADGSIRYYGTATWEGYRGGGLSLRALTTTAREIAGDNHHFRFIQLPFNLGLREPSAETLEGGQTVFDIAAELGITIIASASLLQGRLARDLPAPVARVLRGLSTDAQRAIQFARSRPGIAAALVGMADRAHLAENLAVARIAPLSCVEYQRVCSALSSLSPHPQEPPLQRPRGGCQVRRR